MINFVQFQFQTGTESQSVMWTHQPCCDYSVHSTCWDNSKKSVRWYSGGVTSGVRWPILFLALDVFLPTSGEKGRSVGPRCSDETARAGYMMMTTMMTLANHSTCWDNSKKSVRWYSGQVTRRGNKWHALTHSLPSTGCVPANLWRKPFCGAMVETARAGYMMMTTMMTLANHFNCSLIKLLTKSDLCFAAVSWVSWMSTGL